MRIITGDETGLIKIVNVESNQVSAILGEQGTDHRVSFMNYLDAADEKHLIVLLGNGQINAYDLSRIQEDNTAQNQQEQCLISSYQSIFAQDTQASAQNAIQIQTDAKKTQIKGFHILSDGKGYLVDESSAVQRFEFDVQEETFKNIAQEQAQIFQARSNRIIHASKLSKFDNQRLLFLQKDANPEILDLSQQKIVWKARNVANDWLDLQVPIWDTDAQFRDQSSFYTATAYRKVRLYDTRKNNTQPTLDHQVLIEGDKSPFSRLLLSHCGNYLFASTLLGAVLQLDTRRNMHLVRKFAAGSSGSVRDVALHPQHNFLTSACLDRNLRVFDLQSESKESCLIAKIYLKQKPTCVLFSAQALASDPQKLAALQKEKLDEKVYDGRANKVKFAHLKKHNVKLPFLVSKEKADIGKTPEDKLQKKIKI